jgi:hypothetical protein
MFQGEISTMSPDLELFIQREVESGHFPDREAFLAHAVRMVQLDREDAVRGILAGLADLKLADTNR